MAFLGAPEDEVPVFVFDAGNPFVVGFPAFGLFLAADFRNLIDGDSGGDKKTGEKFAFVQGTAAEEIEKDSAEKLAAEAQERQAVRRDFRYEEIA